MQYNNNHYINIIEEQTKNNSNDDSGYESEQMDYLGPLMDNSETGTDRNNIISTDLINNSQDNESEGENDSQYISLFPPIKSKNSQQEIQIKSPVLYRAQQPKLIKFSNLGSFGLIKCDTITTYFLGMVSCSQFTHPDTILNDNKVNVSFLYRGTSDTDTNKLAYSTEVFKMPQDFKIPRVEKSKMRQFISALNEFFCELDYVNNIRALTFNKRLLYLFTFLCFILLGISLYLLGADVVKAINKKITYTLSRILKTIAISLIVLFVIFGIKYFIGKIRCIPFRFLEEIMYYRIKHADSVAIFIEKWNEELFNSKQIRIWIPASLDYVMFNMDPYQDILIEPHDLEESKKDLA